ncbi:hypothetical protein BU24DRAFT_247519 [Aaosphaeria arxii CBS 175.79]|uniref:Uncharacterized protein n=1 Tax=Aaosphaeria arxii CBS 175.79 TaxID=1450172 RepID=A0A6A5XLR0_9PLEO|nr:uncharacterized protein BU24DRAFT_247519 [Aaosphaeria arxii CBS 175.79]KAF2013799.1 hypothetical protein BU24DRAFT_247519 [Aaosphaeria arxii CBS 175.79]
MLQKWGAELCSPCCSLLGSADSICSHPACLHDCTSVSISNKMPYPIQGAKACKTQTTERTQHRGKGKGTKECTLCLQTCRTINEGFLEAVIIGCGPHVKHNPADNTPDWAGSSMLLTLAVANSSDMAVFLPCSRASSLDTSHPSISILPSSPFGYYPPRLCHIAPGLLLFPNSTPSTTTGL